MGCTAAQVGGVTGRTPCLFASLVSWLPAITMMLVSTISYIDRNTLALLAPSILRDARLSNQQYGYIISGFSIAYMLGSPLWGRIVDRRGVRATMGAAVTLWTVASVSHAFATGFRGLLAARTMLGCGEGATFPGAVRTVTQTVPVSARMRGVGLVYCGGSFGALLTPIVITPIASWWGWRAAFWFTGAVGLLWLALWTTVSRRRELARPIGVVESGGKPHWNDPRLWGFLAAYALGASPIAFVLYQSSIYLSAVFHKSQLEIGHVLWIPPLGWEIGLLFWGWVADHIAPAEDPVRMFRRQFAVTMALSLPLIMVPHVGSYPIVLAALSCSMFAASGFTPGAVAYAARHYSVRHSGLIVGLGSGAWSAFVALEMPIVGKLFDLHWYGAAFSFATLLPVIGFLLWRAFDR